MLKERFAPPSARSKNTRTIISSISHDRHPDLALHIISNARQRRHGRRLRSGGRPARPARGAEVPADELAGSAVARAVPARGARRVRAQPSRTSARSTRSNRRRTSTSSRWSCSRVETLAQRIGTRADRCRVARRNRRADRRRARVGARERDRPSRHQAGQHLRQRPRPGEAARLRPREDRQLGGRSTRRLRPRCPSRSDVARHDDGDRRLHVTRAGERPAHRCAH